jgi:hypothetical protein
MEDQVEPGDEECLSSWRIRFKNLHTHPVYITILNLSPAYGVHQIFPGQGSSSVAVDTGREIQELLIDIRVPTLLKPLAANPDFTMTDVIKLIVTTEQTDFRYYELPDLEPLDTSMNGSEGLSGGKLRNTWVRKPEVASWFVDQKEIVTTGVRGWKKIIRCDEGLLPRCRIFDWKQFSDGITNLCHSLRT